MLILDRYVAREVLKTLVAALGIFLVIFLLATLYELLREGYAPSLIVAIIPFAVAYTIPFLVPIALAIGCALAYGRLAADNEVVPCLTGGLHPAALIWPGVFLGLLVSVVMFGVQATLVPYCYYKKKSVLAKVIEELVSLPKVENKVLSDPKRGFFFFARRCDGQDLEGLELIGFPGSIGVPGTETAGGSGRVELVADRGRISRTPAGRVEIEVQGATVTAFLTEQLGFRDLDRDKSGGLDPGEWREAEWRLHRLPSPLPSLDADGDGALDEAEVAPLLAQAPGGELEFEALDADRDGTLSVRELHELERRFPADPARLSAADRSGDGSVDDKELTAFKLDLDLTQVANRDFVQLHFESFAFEITPSNKGRYRMAFRTNRGLLALRDEAGRWRRWAESEAGPERARADVAAAHAGLLAAVGGPAAALSLASLAAAAPGKQAITDAENLERYATGTFLSRIALSCAPFLFAIISVAVPLLLRSNQRLLPFFVAFCIVSATFFGPFLLGANLADRGRGLNPWLAYAPCILLTLGAGAYLLRRLFRQ